MTASRNKVLADPLGVALGALEVFMVHVGMPVGTPVGTPVAIPGTADGTVGDTILPALFTAARSNRVQPLVWLLATVYDTSGVFGRTALRLLGWGNLLLVRVLAVGCFGLV